MMIPRRIKMMNNLILKKKKYDINFMCNYKYIKILKIFLLWKFKFMKLSYTKIFFIYLNPLSYPD